LDREELTSAESKEIQGMGHSTSALYPTPSPFFVILYLTNHVVCERIVDIGEAHEPE
jgi:hypothetical protein